MTLIELLVVIVIMTTIVAAAIPLLSPSNDDRRIREASRTANTFFTGAQARAVSTNRPYGVALKRLSQDTQKAEDRSVCVEMYYVEQQPPYSGFDANSRACVALHPDPAWAGYVLIRFVTRGLSANNGMTPDGWIREQFPSGMIRPGDVIEINGTQFELVNQYSMTNITPPTSTNIYFDDPQNKPPRQIMARPINNSGQQINPKYDDMGREIGSVASAQSPYWTIPAPYKILRQPTPTSDQPYQLPEGTAIDLRASGVGSGDYFYWPGLHDDPANGGGGILIMFAPEGRVARVSYSQAPDNQTSFDSPVVDNVYLLVGRHDKSPAPDATSDPTLQTSTFPSGSPLTDDQLQKLREPINWLAGSSRWIVIGSQSGRITTIENATVDLAGILDVSKNPPPAPFGSAVPGTEQMRAVQILAAREFTHEMGQLGGR